MEEVSFQKGRGGGTVLCRGEKCILLLLWKSYLGSKHLGFLPAWACHGVETRWLQHPQLNSSCLAVDPPSPPKTPELPSLTLSIAHRKKQEFGATGYWSRGNVYHGLHWFVPRRACFALAALETPKLRCRCLHSRCAPIHSGASSSRKLRSPRPGIARKLLDQEQGQDQGSTEAGAVQHEEVSHPMLDISGQGKGNRPVPSSAGMDAAPTHPWGCLS